MIYLYWYLGVGVVVLAIYLGADQLTKKDEPGSLRGIFNPVHIAVVAMVGLVIIWPFLIYMEGRGIFSKKDEVQQEEDPEFAVEFGHLQERLTVPQIEAREMVVDPLGAVPDLPFGHLNAAWKTFIGSVGADDEIWSFTAPWQTTWGCEEVRAGYVFVRNGAPDAHFLTMWKEIVNEPQDAQGSTATGASTSRKASDNGDATLYGVK